MDDNAKNFLKFLDPATLRENLNTAALYIAIFELCKDIISQRPKDFFTIGFTTDGHIPDNLKSNAFIENDLLISNEYLLKVKSLSRYEHEAALLFLKELGAISDDDITAYSKARKHRNELGHELFAILLSHKRNININLLTNLVEIIDKIEKWWIQHIEIPTNPDFDREEVNPADILPGTTLLIHMLLEVATGSEVEASKYLTALKEYLKNE